MSDTAATPKKKASPFRRRQRRMQFLAVLFSFVALVTVAAVLALNGKEVYFYGPSALPPAAELQGREIRVGGLVEKGTLIAREGTGWTFTVTDGAATVPVIFDAELPSLVAEGDGVVAQGVLREDGVFIANNVLARHDENYMAPEVADALKETGEYEKYINDRRQ